MSLLGVEVSVRPYGASDPGAYFDDDGGGDGDSRDGDPRRFNRTLGAGAGGGVPKFGPRSRLAIMITLGVGGALLAAGGAVAFILRRRAAAAGPPGRSGRGRLPREGRYGYAPLRAADGDEDDEAGPRPRPWPRPRPGPRGPAWPRPRPPSPRGAPAGHRGPPSLDFFPLLEALPPPDLPAPSAGAGPRPPSPPPPGARSGNSGGSHPLLD
eukprot:tig00021760_g23437.t1